MVWVDITCIKLWAFFHFISTRKTFSVSNSHSITMKDTHYVCQFPMSQIIRHSSGFFSLLAHTLCSQHKRKGNTPFLCTIYLNFISIANKNVNKNHIYEWYMVFFAIRQHWCISKLRLPPYTEYSIWNSIDDFRWPAHFPPPPPVALGDSINQFDVAMDSRSPCEQFNSDKNVYGFAWNDLALDERRIWTNDSVQTKCVPFFAPFFPRACVLWCNQMFWI